jgi:hypothetical protein
MNPATLALIAQALQLAIAAAPEVIAVSQKVTELIEELFKADAISIEQQTALKDHMDAVMTAALSGQEPPHWTVEPDPV